MTNEKKVDNIDFTACQCVKFSSQKTPMLILFDDEDAVKKDAPILHDL